MLKRLIPVLLVSFAFAACGEDEGNEPAPIEDFGLADMPVSDASDMGLRDDGSELPTAGVSLTPVAKSLKIAQEFRFNAEARDEDLAVVEMPVLVWTSDDESIVTIDETGLARGIDEGVASVRVAWGDFEATAEVRVVGRFNDIAAGSNHTCGRTTAGNVLCWGANNERQLGVDTDDSTPFAVLLDFETPLFSLAAGDTHTCGLDVDGQAYCWGANDYGQLGDGTTNPSTQPVAVAGNVQFAQLRAGGDTTCGTTVEVETYCWGRNDSGQVGAGVAIARITEPTTVAGGYTFDDISIGASHVCGKAGSNLFCWGDNSLSQLGQASNAASENQPAQWMGLRVFDVAAGRTHNCAARQDLSMVCWGASLGLGSDMVMESDTPVTVMAPTGVQFVTAFAGDDHSCGGTTDINVLCWGRNDRGQLGDGSVEDRFEAEIVLGMPNFSNLEIGDNHTCASSMMGDVFCWGANDDGQIGDGTLTDRRQPTFAGTTNF